MEHPPPSWLDDGVTFPGTCAGVSLARLAGHALEVFLSSDIRAVLINNDGAYPEHWMLLGGLVRSVI